MSGEVPDVLCAESAEHGITPPLREEASMPFIEVTVVQGVFTAVQKREIIERLTDAMVEIEGENMRQLTWCVVHEVPNGDWGIGGRAVTADDVRAIARA
jgi:4-oxalocrotonate tautomerase